jgi:peptidyl-prolyl cis-trans isomerase B (cyclophilin B)
VPSNEQRRQAAKRKLERQLARRAERAKKRRVWGVGITVLVVVAVVGLVFWLTNLGPDDSQAAKDKDVGMPEDPADTPKEGALQVDLKTSQGDIGLTLDRAKAPCTVQSMEHLITEKYFDGTKCHRLTTSPGLEVLQCGDPKGDGSGGPGYSLPDELPKDLTDAGKAPDGTPLKLYERGMLAMANGGPNTGGSQFFLVYKDSKLPPNYTVFGEVDDAGLQVLDKIAKGGVTPVNSPQDGTPKLPVDVESATIAD